MIGMYVMIVWGLFQIFVLGDHLQAETANFTVKSEHGDVLGFAMVFLVARAFSSRRPNMTRAQNVDHGVPAFRKPPCRNAASALLLLRTRSCGRRLSVAGPSRGTGAKVVDTPEQL